MTSTTTEPARTPDVARMARILADRSAILHVITYSAMERRADGTWWDTRPMVDPREHAGNHVFTDVARMALDYARARGLITLHPGHPHLVQIGLTHAEKKDPAR